MGVRSLLVLVIVALLQLAVDANAKHHHHAHLRIHIDSKDAKNARPHVAFQRHKHTKLLLGGASESRQPQPLPVFFFHGATSNTKAGYNYNLNLTAEGRAFVALDFCTDLCSISALNAQVQMAILKIRATVASDPRFANGYIFMGHSQGGVIARAVIEEMDDHKVHTLISLAGAQNGILLNFPLLRVMDMKLTEEYDRDTYGLKMLEARGGLFMYSIPNVSHSCWLVDAIPLGKTEPCLFKPVFDDYIYPVLHAHGWGQV